MGPSAAPQARCAMSPPSRRRQHGVNATASPVKVGDGSQPLRQAVIRVLLATTLVALISGGMAWLLGAHDVAGIFWAAGTLVAILPAVWWVVAALRRGRVGADIIAVLALVGTPAIHDYLAGRVDQGNARNGAGARSRRRASRGRRISDRYWSVPHALRVDGQRPACRRCRSTRSPSAMCSWWVAAKFFLSMGWSLRTGRFSMNRRSPVNSSTVTTERVKRCAVGRSMPVGPWRFAPQHRRMRAPTRALCEWLSRPWRKAPPWSASPIAS